MDISPNPLTQLDRVSSDGDRPRVRRPTERTAFAGSNPCALLERARGYKAQPRVEATGENSGHRLQPYHTIEVAELGQT